MKVYNASEVKAKCLALLDEVAATGEPVTVTKQGNVVAQLVPAVPEDRKSPLEALRGTVEIVGDVVSPPLAADEWDDNPPK